MPVTRSTNDVPAACSVYVDCSVVWIVNRQQKFMDNNSTPFKLAKLLIATLLTQILSQAAQ